MARMITAPGIIRHIDKYTNTMRKLQFSIAVGDWTESSGVYTAEWLNDYITASSFEIATYDHTLRDNGKGDIELEKKSGGGGLVFTTNALPTGTITGIVYVFDTQDGKLPVLLEDGTVEIEQGGTGATTAAGALANFGLDNAEHAQEALGFGDAVQMDVANSLATSQAGYVLDARQGKALNDTLNSNMSSNQKNLALQAWEGKAPRSMYAGDFIYWNNVLYRAKQNISGGTVLTSSMLESVQMTTSTSLPGAINVISSNVLRCNHLGTFNTLDALKTELNSFVSNMETGITNVRRNISFSVNNVSPFAGVEYAGEVTKYNPTWFGVFVYSYGVSFVNEAFIIKRSDNGTTLGSWMINKITTTSV